MKKHFFIMTCLCLYLSNYSISQEVWTKTSLIDKYPVNCMATIGNDLYAGLGGGGLYKSTDEGSTWTEINNGIGSKIIVAIASNGNKIYVSSYTEGIYVSTNKGESWTQLKNVPNQFVYSLALSGSHLIISTWEGIYYTKDDETWSRSLINGEKKHHLTTSLFESKKGLLAGSGKYIFFSDDNGKTFVSYPAVTKFDIGTFTESNGSIIAGTTGDGLIVSPDGKNWAKKTAIKSENELR